MEIIKNPHNKIANLCKKLHFRKYRDQYSKFVCEGEILVKESELYAKELIEYILISENFLKQNGDYIKILEQKFKVNCFENKVYKSLSSTTSPQGILAIVKKFKHEIKVSTLKLVLILEEISNPGNLGSIIRTSEAAGFECIFLIGNCVDVYNSKTVRSSMGSIFRVKTSKLQNLSLLKDEGFLLYGNVPNAIQYINEEKFQGKVALVFGNENAGISKELLKNCDRKITIPMCGKVESLNAAEAASIAMYFVKFLSGKCVN